MSTLLFAILCAVAAVCYHAMLIRAGKPSAGFHYLLKRGEQALRGRFGYDLYCFITTSLRECLWCLAGQLALVYYVVATPLPELLCIPVILYLFGLLFSICTAIVSSAIIFYITDHAIESSN